jgi:hypothetical protein
LRDERVIEILANLPLEADIAGCSDFCPLRADFVAKVG